jgi:hypothetical protein
LCSKFSQIFRLQVCSAAKYSFVGCSATAKSNKKKYFSQEISPKFHRIFSHRAAPQQKTVLWVALQQQNPTKKNIFPKRILRNFIDFSPKFHRIFRHRAAPQQKTVLWAAPQQKKKIKKNKISLKFLRS